MVAKETPSAITAETGQFNFKDGAATGMESALNRDFVHPEANSKKQTVKNADFLIKIRISRYFI
jgi:hypothetical protein